MLLFTHPKIRNILMERYGYPPDLLDNLQMTYINQLTNLIVNETLDYIEEQNLPAEKSELEDLLATQNKKMSAKAKDTEDFYKIIFKFIERFPDLQEIINKKVSVFNQEVVTVFLENAGDEVLAQIINIAAEDLKASGSSIFGVKWTEE